MSEGWRDICEAVGVEAALHLACAFAGRRLYIPCHAHRAQAILPVLGLAATERLCAAFGGLSLELPVSPAKLYAVHRLRQQGLSVNAIAARLLMSRSGVKSLLRQSPPASPAPQATDASRQMNLFETEGAVTPPATLVQKPPF